MFVRTVWTIAVALALLPVPGSGPLWAQGAPQRPATHDPARHGGGGHGHAGGMAGAPAADAASPYAGQERREIKALSDGEVRELLQGAGMGLAKAAELNRYPGPRHVLELAGELELSAEQRGATEALFAAMRAEAVALGTAIVARERELDARFAQGRMDAEALAGLTAEIGRLQGALRAAHLRAHLEMRRILSPRQSAAYDQLRGYASR
jgi:Spy/CpxP family protein refolding chaperone